MKSTSHLQRVGLAGACVAIVAIAVAMGARTQRDSAAQPAKAAPVRNAYLGNLHVHTSWSNDGYNLGVRATPDDAYLFAEGEPIRLNLTGELVKLNKPLDFMGVTEHAEYQGIMSKLTDPNSPLFNTSFAKQLRSDDNNVRLKAVTDIMTTVMAGKPIPEFVDKKMVAEVWHDIIKTANKHNKPGKFTAFIGIEWSSNGPKGYQNLHRNTIYRGDKAVDECFTTFDSLKPEDLWTFNDNARKQGLQLLAIPHNPNYSGGLMFLPEYSDGRPIDRAYAEQRMENEPLVEIMQCKGASETHPVLSPDDEFAGFELSDFVMNLQALGSHGSPRYSYVRDAYKMGLVLEEKLGVNPFKFGVIGSADIHMGPVPYRQDDFFGTLGTMDDNASRRLQTPGGMGNMIRSWGPSGLAGVWAEENSRESIYDALHRKETFATSGNRIHVRFFGGWDYKSGEDKGENFARTGYEKGVPMGGDLAVRPDMAKAPTFLVWAEKDSEGANLDRIQMIKGWAKHGQSFEKIYDLAWSGGRVRDMKTGRLTPVGNTVDVSKPSYTNTIGTEKLSAVWQDPEFDPDLRAFYYLRVLEIPTPRWNDFDAKKLGITPPDPTSLQGRAWSSPIWYTPTDAELAKVRAKALTIAGLENDKAKALSTEEIKALLIGKEVRIKNLLTGEEYTAAYGEDGIRTLAATAGFAAAHGQGAAKNPYAIKDDKLSGQLDDGSQFSSRLYKHGGRYLAARDDEAGYVNYEVFSR